MSKILKGAQFFEPDFPIYLNRETEAFQTGQHEHDFIEMSLVAEGCGYHYIDHALIKVQKGDLFLLPKGTSHVFRPSSASRSKPLIIMNFLFDLKALEPVRQWIPFESQLYKCLYEPHALSRAWSYYRDDNDRFLSLFQQAYFEYSNRSVGYRPIITALLLQTLQLIHRVQTEESVPDQASSSSASDKIKDILNFIEQNYSDKITLKSLAEQYFMSGGHFQNQFKRITGQTFNQYIQNVRIQKCCQLLKTTNKTVQETANDVGYTDMKFFHSLFRKITGSSPQQFRRIRA